MKQLFSKLKILVLSLVSSTPQTIDWIVQVKSKQTYGQYDMLITDMNDRVYNLSVGALIVGKNKIQPMRWREVFDRIDVGTTLNVRIRANELAEATGLNQRKTNEDSENLQIRTRYDVQGSGGVNILRVNAIR